MNCKRFKNRFKELCSIREIKTFAKKKTGGIVLFLFIIQFITGMVLSLYYIPYFEQAHKSIIDIVTKLNMGWFFRSLHHWGAQLIMAALFIHAFSILLSKSYRKPKDLLWFSGFILLGISIFFGLSGYLLVWNERAFAAVKVATGGAGSLPIIGSFIKCFLRGGIDVTGETLTRFHAFHVSILPIIAIFLVCIHIFFIQYRLVIVPLSFKKRTKQPPFFPYRFYKYLIICLIAFGITVTLATLFPPEIGKGADPLIKRFLLASFFIIKTAFLFASQETVEAFPSAPYDRYIVYETLALFWIAIIGLIIIISMKLKEIERIQGMGIDKKEKDIPLLD